jgi:cystathionine beta-lyase/cystathionine gamma-synthase
MQTLAVRQQRAAATAEEIATWLATQQAVKRVLFPGLGTHPDHRVARTQLSNGYGSTLSFEIDGEAEGAERFVRALDMITLVHSLGGVRTTLSHAATMTHRSLSPAERTSAGLHAGFFRLSVGLEDAADIAADLRRGLAELSS